MSHRVWFVLPVRIDAVDEAHAWRIARSLEQLLRDRARAGVQVEAPELVDAARQAQLREARRRKQPRPAASPAEVTTGEVERLYGAAAVEWLLDQWHAGAVTKCGRDRWRLRPHHLDELAAIDPSTSSPAVHDAGEDTTTRSDDLVATGSAVRRLRTRPTARPRSAAAAERTHAHLGEPVSVLVEAARRLGLRLAAALTLKGDLRLGSLSRPRCVLPSFRWLRFSRWSSR